jgi:hypothetical protein
VAGDESVPARLATAAGDNVRPDESVPARLATAVGDNVRPDESVPVRSVTAVGDNVRPDESVPARSMTAVGNNARPARPLPADRAEGTLVSDARDDELLDMAFGPIWFRLLTRPEALTEEFGDLIAHALLEDRPVPALAPPA